MEEDIKDHILKVDKKRPEEDEEEWIEIQDIPLVECVS